MATLTVWKFPTADGAEKAEETLAQLQTEGLIKVHDRFEGTQAELISSNLSKDQEKALLESFREDS
ncbi:MAG: hypothetical protein ACR2HV_07835 [Acidimicrobiales bacterium]